MSLERRDLGRLLSTEARCPIHIHFFKVPILVYSEEAGNRFSQSEFVRDVYLLNCQMYSYSYLRKVFHRILCISKRIIFGSSRSQYLQETRPLYCVKRNIPLIFTRRSIVQCTFAYVSTETIGCTYAFLKIIFPENGRQAHYRRSKVLDCCDLMSHFCLSRSLQYE